MATCLRALFWLVFVAMATLGGCQLFAGDFTIEPATGSQGTGDCKTGDYRCNGEYLLTCGSADAGWLVKKSCGGANLCDSKGKQCQACKPGELRCDGASRQECALDGSGWKEVEACAEASMCNPTYCGKCTPGEFSCRGARSNVGSELWECDADGAWTMEHEYCTTPGLCRASIDAGRANPDWDMTCMQPACELDEYDCDGAILRHCRPDQTAWDVVDTCGTPELCELGRMNGAQVAGVIDMCPTGCGTAGTFVCDDKTLQQCREDLTGFDTLEECAPGTECNPVAGACTDLCTPGEYQCNGATLRHCDNDRHWKAQETCASAALCVTSTDPVPSGECLPPGCPKAGDYACDGTALSKCRDDLAGFDPVAECATPELCSAADKRCNEPVCGPDELRCFDNNELGSQLRKCTPDRRGWTVEDNCEQGQFCSNDPLDPGCKLECPAPTRCNGQELEHCTANGWIHQATCATNDLCSCTLTGTCSLGVAADGCGVVVCGGTLPANQCVGAQLQACQPGRNGWGSGVNCGEAALCYPGAAPGYTNGYCATCPTAGELRCMPGTPNAALQRCSPDRTMWTTTQTCTIACLDSGTQDYCAICNTGQVMCSGATLQKCGTERRSWVSTTCASAALCDAPNGQCDVCPPNQNSCAGTTFQHCSSDGQTLQTQVCPNYCDAAGGQCDSCIANTSRCQDNVLFKCSADGQSETSTLCATAALCNATTGVCTAPTCEVGQRRCNNGQPQVCNSNRNGWDNSGTPCATVALCNTANGTCNTAACNVGQRRCNDGQPQICNANRTAYEDTGAACASVALCNTATGMCTPPTCEPGQTQCNGAQPQVCNMQRNGYVNTGTACASAALCNASTGTCTAPTCEVGETQCSGRQPQVCNASRNGWTSMGSPCATNALCVAATGTCTAPTCEPNQLQCSGAMPQVCNANQNGWTNSPPACATSQLCSAGVCTAPACDVGQTTCMGAQPQICNAGRTGYAANGSPCENATLCMNGMNGMCQAPACTAGQKQCMGATLRVCNSTLTGWVETTCATAALCDATAGMCNPPACMANEYNCNAGVLEQCNAGRTGWTAIMTCASQALCDETNHECDECVPGTNSCTGNVLSTCDSTGHFVVEDCTESSATCDATAGVCVPP